MFDIQTNIILQHEPFDFCDVIILYVLTVMTKVFDVYISPIKEHLIVLLTQVLVKYGECLN